VSYLVCGTWNIAGLTIPAMLWTVAAFRPDRDPQITQLVNDLAWLFWIMVASVPILQNILFGLCVLSDKMPKPLFPRWFGYFQFWIALGLLPATVITFFKTGPLSWNGLISFWFVVVLFGVFIVVEVLCLFRAVNREDY
jgi:hypothetical protein